MPRIPQAFPSETIPGSGPGVPISAEALAAPYSALERVGKTIQDIGQKGLWVARQQEEQALEKAERYKKEEETAIRKVEALKIGRKMRGDIERVAESYSNREDYENFDTDAQKALDEIWKRYDSEVNDPVLKRAIEGSFQGHALYLENTIRARKAKAITDVGLSEWSFMKDHAIKQWVSDPTEEGRELVRAKFEMQTLAMPASIMPARVKEQEIQKFNAHAEEAYVREMINLDPERAVGELLDKKLFPNIDPIKRTALYEHADVKMRQEGTRQEKLTKAVQRENATAVLNDLDAGILDMDKLRSYRAPIKDTGLPGLSDEVFAHYRGILLSGKDVQTDWAVFNRLQAKPRLTEAEVNQNLDSLNQREINSLLSHVRQTSLEDIREARHYQRQEEAQIRSEQRQMETAKKQRAADLRSKNYQDAHALMNKGFKELTVKPEQEAATRKAFQAMIADPEIKPDEWIEKTQKLLEPLKPVGIWERIFSTKPFTEAPNIAEGVPPAFTPGIIVVPNRTKEMQQQRANEIFGVKK